MKKVFTLLFSVLFIFTLCACSSENEMSELEKQYYDYAQECIEKGDTQTAIDSLEEGITNTGSEELQKLLDEIKGGATSDENAENAFSKYAGDWIVPNGGMPFVVETKLTMNIKVNGDKVTVDITYADLSDDGTTGRESVAKLKKEVKLSDIKGDTLTLLYTDDACGNSGKLILTFTDEYIFCESDYYTQDYWFWGFLFEGGICKFERI